MASTSYYRHMYVLSDKQEEEELSMSTSPRPDSTQSLSPPPPNSSVYTTRVLPSSELLANCSPATFPYAAARHSPVHQSSSASPPLYHHHQHHHKRLDTLSDGCHTPSPDSFRSASPEIMDVHHHQQHSNNNKQYATLLPAGTTPSYRVTPQFMNVLMYAKNQQRLIHFDDRGDEDENKLLTNSVVDKNMNNRPKTQLRKSVLIDNQRTSIISINRPEDRTSICLLYTSRCV